MKRLFVAVLSLAVVLLPGLGMAKTTSVNPDDVQAPRAPAGARLDQAGVASPR